MGGNVLHESLGQQGRSPCVQGEALTFEAYSAHMLDVWKRTNLVRPVHVQVRKRGIVLCGRVVEASPGNVGSDWFKVDSYLGQLWFVGDNVRMCSGDGRCSCEVAV